MHFPDVQCHNNPLAAWHPPSDPLAGFESLKVGKKREERGIQWKGKEVREREKGKVNLTHYSFANSIALLY